jgi:hypothetical protein
LAAAFALALLPGCSGPSPKAGLDPQTARGQATESVVRSPDPSSAAPRAATPAASPVTHRPAPPPTVPGYCRQGGSRLWAHLAVCGWPGPGSTGPDMSHCPDGRLLDDGGSLERTITIDTPDTVISCKKIMGLIDIQARNVTIRDSVVSGDSGRTGEDANGTAVIKVEDGASAVIDRVTVIGNDGVHACIWHQGTSLVVDAVNCSGADDGIWSWPDASYSGTTGNHFVIENSYLHDFTTRTSNGHEDGYQTEGASFGIIRHNTFRMTADADSAIAIWDGLRSAKSIRVTDNLITGGGFSIYAEDYDPGDSSPGNPSAAGGFQVSDIVFTRNFFSTFAAPCVGQFGVWFYRPSWLPYHGGPSDGWNRQGNTVIETGQNIDDGNPQAAGQACG